MLEEEEVQEKVKEKRLIAQDVTNQPQGDQEKPSTGEATDGQVPLTPETPEKYEYVEVMKTRKKTNRTDLLVTTRMPPGWLQPEQKKQFHEEELNMQNDDRVQFETREKLNELESYVYGMRDKLNGAMKEFMKPHDTEQFLAILQATEDWLYDNAEAAKSVFVAKLEELQKIGDPVDRRYNESTRRPQALADFIAKMNEYQAIASPSNEATSHIDADKKDEIRRKAEEHKTALDHKIAMQTGLAPYDEPTVTIAQINSTLQEFESWAKPILNAPKPAPPPSTSPAAPTVEEPTADPMDIE